MCQALYNTFPFVLMTSLKGKDYYYSHLTDEETEAQLRNSVQAVQPQSLWLSQHPPGTKALLELPISSQAVKEDPRVCNLCLSPLSLLCQCWPVPCRVKVLTHLWGVQNQYDLNFHPLFAQRNKGQRRQAPKSTTILSKCCDRDRPSGFPYFSILRRPSPRETLCQQDIQLPQWLPSAQSLPESSYSHLPPHALKLCHGRSSKGSRRANRGNPEHSQWQMSTNQLLLRPGG
jgi:hypothetical protein